MRFFKRVFAFLFLSFVIFMLAGGFCIFYAFQIEPYRLKVKEYTLNEQENGAEDIKVVQFSDLHIKEDYTAENLENGHKYVDTEDGDRILFTGLDDSMLGSPYLPGFEDSSAAEFKILLMHEPDSAADYSGGMYEPAADGSSRLYVNTGIGTTHISARFGVVPEITVFHIYL